MLLGEFFVSTRHLGQEEISTKDNEEKEEKSIKLEDAVGSF